MAAVQRQTSYDRLANSCVRPLSIRLEVPASIHILKATNPGEVPRLSK